MSKLLETEQRLTSAIADLAAGVFPSERRAAESYGLCHSTLNRRRKEVENRVKSHAHQQVLSPTQEGTLARWLLEAEAAGHAFNHQQIREMASLISQASGGPAQLGKNWVRKFIKRNPTLQTKKGVAVSSQRVHDLYLSAFKSWFSVLQSLFICKGVRDCNIYNMDETGNALGPCANQTIIGSKESKQSYISTPEDREWVSVIEAICADGSSLQPLVIFKGQSVQMQWFIPERTPHWTYTASKSAYTSNDTGLYWLEEIFIPQTASKLRQNEYRLLLLDGHRSHCTLEFMWKCFENRIIPYYLVAHASHIMQPLDLTVFSSLKTK